MGVEITAAYKGELRVEATHKPSGAQIATDAPLDNGGQGQSFSPTDLVATALGSCVLTILGLLAERHQLNLSGARVHVTKEMIQKPMRRIGSLRTVVTLAADTAPPELRDRLEAAARTCPVHRSLHPDIDAPIEFIYE